MCLFDQDSPPPQKNFKILDEESIYQQATSLWFNVSRVVPGSSSMGHPGVPGPRGLQEGSVGEPWNQRIAYLGGAIQSLKEAMQWLEEAREDEKRVLQQLIKISITLKKEFKFTREFNMDLEWRSYFYQTLATIPHFNCGDQPHSYPHALCDQCKNKHYLNFGYHYVTLAVPPELLEALRQGFSDHCWVESLK